MALCGVSCYKEIFEKAEIAYAQNLSVATSYRRGCHKQFKGSAQ